MPIFDFRCLECNNAFEKLVKNPAEASCPQCGATRLEKLISNTSPPGHSARILSGLRARAEKEGHFSNYRPSERPKR